MRLNLGQKLTAVIVVPAILSAALSIFALVELRIEHDRSRQIGTLSTMRLHADDLAEAVRDIVIAADGVAIEPDRTAAKTRLAALKQKLGAFDVLETAFFNVVGATIPEAQRTQVRLRLADFKSYQSDTAELGLKVTPQAAQIQALDPSTIENREFTIAILDDVKRTLVTKIEAEQVHIAELQNRTMALLVVVPLLSIILGLGLVTFVVRSQIRTPLDALKTTMAALAAGRLDGAVPCLGRRDEIGEMAGTLAVFRDALLGRQLAATEERDRTVAIVHRADKIVDVTRAFERQAFDMMRDLSASVASMDVAARDVATTSNRTHGEAQTVRQAAEDATKILGSVSDRAGELSAAATQISTQVEATYRATRDTLGEIAANGATIETLIEAASQIGGAAGLIEGIARQTNLLALNATIEAARAGDSGRGFAIVAGEVKFLARQTAEATDQIADQVAKIQDASTMTASVMQKIHEALEAVDALSAQVAGAAARQGESSREIALALLMATERARVVSQNIGNVSRSASANGSSAEELKAKARHHAEQSSRLSGVIGDFAGEVRRMA